LKALLQTAYTLLPGLLFHSCISSMFIFLCRFLQPQHLSAAACNTFVHYRMTSFAMP